MTQWGRRLGTGALITASVLLVLILLNALSIFYHDYKLITAPVVPKTTVLSQNQTNMVAKLPELHLFGKPGTVSQILPITSLQLKLVGVVKAVPDRYSRVIISEGGKPGQVYQIGDTLSSGVRIHGITKEGVILENGGRLEKLPLQRTPVLFQGPPKGLLPNERNRGE